MLAIARGLMARPKILLLDEPSLGLAPSIVDDVFRVIADLRDEGRTILLVDQLASHALVVADRGYVLEQGQVVVTGTSDRLRQMPALEAAYHGASTATASAK
jgi:ABC-type branched-subunit amino acid transport system ATPase component